MKYTNIELKGYKRLLLSNIDYLNLKPTQPIQLIIGTNGSGKSSLVSEITPLPSNKDDFSKEGYKKITIMHKGIEYLLTSEFSPKTRYSFIKDNEELNVGGTGSVQKELVRQEFGITSEIHEMMLGKLCFTVMGPGQRREWFTNLSETNYEFAIGYYNKLRERLRDTSGALKLAKKRLIAESSKIINNEDRLNLEQEVNSLHELLQHLNEFRKPTEFNLNELKNTIETDIKLLETICQSVLKFSFKIINNPNKNIINIDKLINENKNKISVNQQLINKYYEEHNKINKATTTIKEAGSESSSVVKDLIVNLTNEQVRLRTTRHIIKNSLDNTEDVYRAFETVNPFLEGLFVELPNNEDKKYHPDKRDENINKIHELNDRIQHGKSIRETLNAKKIHLEEHKSVGPTECPKCKHSWHVGFSELVYNETVKQLDENLTKLTDLEKQLVICKTYDEEVNNYLSLYRSFINQTKAWPVLQVLWDHLINNKHVLNNPKRALQECGLFAVDLRSELECFNLEKQIQQHKEKIKLLETIESQDVEKLLMRQKELEDLIQSLTIEVTQLTKRNVILETTVKDIGILTDLSIELEEKYNILISNTDNVIETERRQLFNQTLRDIQSNLARKENILSEVKIQKGIIDDVTKQIAKYELDELSLKALVDQLSPTDGLIAEGLMGFIKMFVSQMNLFIKKIWTYPLIVVPCGLSDDGRVELDYKFPVIVKDKNNTTIDVSKCSTAQQKVINLAYVVTAMKYLGLGDSPIYIDEFSAGLDDAHRTSSMYAIKTLMEQHPFTQMFLIDHYQSTYGAFTNAEICVINKENVVIPANAEYNKHVIMN